jgi:cardiolipin synthase
MDRIQISRTSTLRQYFSYRQLSLFTSVLWAGAAGLGISWSFPDSAHAIPAQFGLSPDHSQELLVRTIASAKRKLDINIYEFDSPTIADAIVERVRAGVRVRLLAETRLANGEYSAPMRSRLRQILAAIRQQRARSPKGGDLGSGVFLKFDTTRFRFNHAKFLIVDRERILVSSENFKDSGHPTPGTVGNRGWEVVVTDQKLASELEAIFESDIDTSHDDVRQARSIPSGGREPGPASPPQRRSIAAIPSRTGQVDSATLITAPAALDPLVDLIRSATTRLEIQFMSLPENWGQDPSPLVTEIIDAAYRGVDVRVLLNKPFGVKDLKNVETATLLETYGQCETGLNISARIIDARAMGVKVLHNKGILVDGQRTLVSSINGTQNSVTNNREVAVLLEGAEAASYYGGAFDFDWKASPEILPYECDLSLSKPERFRSPGRSIASLF